MSVRASDAGRNAVTLPIRLIVEPEPQSGDWNMAVDAALLSSAVESRTTTLRWYRWNEPTVSLGYFQRATETAAEIAALPTVRRLSGGGAIVHDREITYSLALPPTHPRAAAPVALYDLVHRAVVDVLRSLGVPATLRGASGEPTGFLCFGRNDRHDVILNGYKIVGSAQRRRRGAVLQHGSIILARSVHTPQFPGLWDLHPTHQPPELPSIFAEAIVRALGGESSTGGLTDTERCRAQRELKRVGETPVQD